MLPRVFFQLSQWIVLSRFCLIFFRERPKVVFFTIETSTNAVCVQLNCFLFGFLNMEVNFNKVHESVV